jgi:HAD superfamily hydrolase (TIGR01509 family)
MSAASSLRILVENVDVLSLDAGNTVVFLDHARVAALCGAHGFATSADALKRAEGEAKLAQERGEEFEVDWSHAHLPAARGWGRTVATMLARAGAARDLVPSVVDALWPAHRDRNLWSLVPPGLLDALGRARASGARVVVVSNSEGQLERIFRQLGILDAFDLVIDSGAVGVEKPDPRIFQMALEPFGAFPERALHLGDNFATDVLGARAARMRVALIDPFEHLRGRHADVPRVADVAEVALALAGARRP